VKRLARFPRHGPELRALLAACHADPDDDTPRLVLADWLEEHDDPRGECVRLQVRLAATPANDPQYDDLFGRHREWWAKHGKLWEKEVRHLMWAPGPHDRGLPTVGHYAAEQCWLETGDLRDPKRDRTSAVVADGWPGMTWVLYSPLATGMDWDDSDDDPDPIDPDEGDVGGGPPDPRDAFRKPPWAGSPTPVGISFSEDVIVPRWLIDEVAEIPNLRGLSLYETDASPAALPRIARLQNLEHLDLGNLRLDDKGLKTLAPLKRLRTLIARDAAPLTNRGAAALAKFKELRDLRLGCLWPGRFGGTGCRAIGKLAKLEVLQLDWMDDAGVRLLGKLPRLRRLDLTGTNATGRGLENFPLLTELNLDSTRADDVGMASVAKLPRLRLLNVSGTRITGASLAHLAGLRWLEDLYAGSTAIRDADLAQLEPLANLETVMLDGTKVTKQGVARLKSKLKHAAVWR
jgi:uncharacterized protein (TIGR02996 family)